MIGRIALTLLLALVLAPRVAPACVEDEAVRAPNLHEWERELLRDCAPGGSRLGDVRPFGVVPAGASAGASATARAHVLLGLKALHNFFYDLCKHEFDAAIARDPTLVWGFWGRALCNAQLLWNSEDVNASRAVLLRAPNATTTNNDDQRAALYFDSVWALNGADDPPRNDDDDVARTRTVRYQAYKDKLVAIAAKYPEDKTARAFVALATLALGSVGECVAARSSNPKCDAELVLSRKLLRDAYDADPTFPGYLHYGMHAHDFPDATVVSAGLVYARDYPKYVTRATHSLHMPSHLFDRSGDFRSGELSNRASVWAGDAFARGGALSDIGNAPPFSFNAGNLYHSLEYEHYELLQMCALGMAGSRLRRMIRATSQAMSNESEPWYRATTFTQWEMKMVARQTMWAVAASLMSSSSSRFLNRGASLRRGSEIDVDSAAAQNKDPDEQEMRWREQWIGISTAPALPRLSWKGATVYSHSFYSPSAEAGYYAALAVALLFETLQKGKLDGARANIGALSDKAVDTDVCGSYPMPNGPNGPNGIEEDVGDLDCVGPRVAAALTIIDGAAAHYTNLGIHYEANFAEQLGFQVRGLLHIVNGDTTAASVALSAATALERDVRGIILPSSTSVFFMPSSAWEGVLRHTLMSGATDAPAAAAEAFAQCLSDDGHPNMPLCLVGSARLSSDSTSSSTRYRELLKQWGALQNGTLSLPRCQCSALLEEARIAVGWQSGRSGSGSVSGQGNGPEWATGSVVLVGTGGMLAGMVLGALLLHFGLRSRKKERSGSTCAVPSPQQNVENNRLLSGDASR